MIIDFHAHCFPEKIASAALEKIGRNAGALRPRTDGTPEGLREHMARCGVDAAVALNIATSPAQQRAVNDFAAGINGGGIFAFGSVHPDAPDALEELERIRALGLKGLKLHPHFQKFSACNKKVFPIYRKAASLGLITVFHAGHDLGFADSAAASPGALAKALNAFGGAPVVAAHLGGCLCWKDACRSLAGLPVYFDTAFCHGHIPLPEARAIVGKHGVENILFGSDLPWSGMDEEAAFIKSLGLTQAEAESIFFSNAAKLLGLPCQA